MVTKQRAMSSRAKRRQDNAPVPPHQQAFKLRSEPRKSKVSETPIEQCFTCFCLVEGEADCDFFEHLQTFYPAKKNVKLRIRPINGGNVDLYRATWKRHYNGEPGAFFLFDADLHPRQSGEMAEDTSVRLVREILEKPAPHLCQHACDATKPTQITGEQEGPVENTDPPPSVLGLLIFPCLESLLLNMLDCDTPGSCSRHCKRVFAETVARRLNCKYSNDLGPQQLTVRQWKKLFPKDVIERQKGRLPGLRALLRILQTGR